MGKGLLEETYRATDVEFAEYCAMRESFVSGRDMPTWRERWLTFLQSDSTYLRYRAFEAVCMDLIWNFDRQRLFTEQFLRDLGVVEIVRKETHFRPEAYLVRVGLQDVTAEDDIRKELVTALPTHARKLERCLNASARLSQGLNPWWERRAFTLHATGEALLYGTVTQILAKAGHWVQKGTVILELENDKAILEVPSPYSGRLKEWNIQMGETAVSGMQLCVIEERL